MAEKTRQLIALLAVLTLVGCASGGSTIRAGDIVDTPAPAASATPGGSTETGSGPPEYSRQPGAVALQSQAGQERAAGDYARAAATLERALRIDAADPNLWLALAEIRLAQDQPVQAAQLARRAASLARQDSPIHRRALDLQAAAATMSGRGR